MTGTPSPASLNPVDAPTSGKVLARFHWDCGRMGHVEGLFVTTPQALQAAYGKHVYFGEILGKHSDISGPLGEGDIRILTDDADFLAKLETFVGADVAGYNPLNYLAEE